MPRRTTPLVAGNIYHLFNRGHNKGNIFFEPENYLFFLKRLRHHLKPAERVTILAYCLMPNHYHLLLRPLDDELSKYMQVFSISYTKAINKRYSRVGGMFQGSFQAKFIDRDEYLIHISRYIHLNPVHAGIVKYPEEWQYSSYLEHIGLRAGTLPDPGYILDYFDNSDDYRVFVDESQETDFEVIKHLTF